MFDGARSGSFRFLFAIAVVECGGFDAKKYPQCMVADGE